jgi:hypothetical protein
MMPFLLGPLFLPPVIFWKNGNFYGGNDPSKLESNTLRGQKATPPGHLKLALLQN